MKNKTLSCTVASLLWGRDKDGNLERKSLPYTIDNWFENLEEAVEVFGDESTVVERFRSKEDAHGPKGDARRAYYAEIAKFEKVAKGYRPEVLLVDQLSYYAMPEDEREKELPEIHNVKQIDLFAQAKEGDDEANAELQTIVDELNEHLEATFGSEGPSTHFGVTVTIAKDLLEDVKGFVNAQLTGESAAKAYEGVLKGATTRGYARLERIFPTLPDDAGSNEQFVTEFARWKKFRDEWEIANKKAEDLLADMS